ncbi:hypothetical protein NY2A_B820L [Paramecium bursaria Chlorella virus NY2A]|uniref:Uncharacterized protein B820L n=1 Tax=Paramecium bursaria Chlorella virus NY2A TaxID=46021 RepID=A7IXZ5_PBCVN|nr:hypothetical protein NY2A_B820L [Paramecium bursaria Chlorella virus NY2A]ABT15219.1 hypothetical protein NY2A_B820L [Paramecium bursaria Chlorella virus NY2A]
MLSALIHIKTKEKSLAEDATIPTIRKIIKPKESKQKSKKNPKKRMKMKSFEDDIKEDIDYASFTPLSEKNENEPKPWNDDDDLEGGNIKFDNDRKHEDENEKYLRQDTEWKDVVKRQKNKFDEDSDEDSDEDTSSEIKSPSIASQEYTDGHTDDNYSEIGDLADLDDFDIGDDESEICDDVFYPKPIVKEQKEKPKRVFVGADITFDDEFIP